MKSIRRRFYKIKNNNENWGDFSCFAEAVHQQGFTRRTIVENFDKLVSPHDYDPSEKNQIIRYLSGLSNKPRTAHFRGKMPQKR